MTDPFSEKLKQVFEGDYPADLHGRIVGGINFWRLKRVFYGVFFLLFVNFLIAGAFFVLRLIDNDALLFINFMVREFEASRSYFYQFAGVLYDAVPMGLFFTLLINVILAAYIIKTYLLFKKNSGRLFLGQAVIKN